MLLAGESPSSQWGRSRAAIKHKNHSDLLNLQLSAIDFFDKTSTTYVVCNDETELTPNFQTDRVRLVRSHDSKGSLESLKSVLQAEHIAETIYLIYSDCLLSPEVLERLHESSHVNAILTEDPSRVNLHEHRVFLERVDTVKEISRPLMEQQLPWQTFAGGMKLSFKTLENLKAEVDSSEKDLLLWLGLNSEAIQLRAVNRSRNLSGWSEAYTPKLSGGSLASLKSFSTVRKHAHGEAAVKLKNEAAWLNQMNELHPRRFPKVLEQREIEDGGWLFEMPYYRLPSLRDLIFLGRISVPEASRVMSEILDFNTRFLYSYKFEADGEEWLRERHYKRFFVRNKSQNYPRSPLSLAMQARELVVNGVALEPPARLVTKIFEDKSLVRSLSPASLRHIHGDLHFQNILLREWRGEHVDFLLVDPRGELRGGDPFYDFGKLLHSAEGLYDFYHTDRVEVELISSENNRIEVRETLPFSSALTSFTALKEPIMGSIQRVVENDRQMLGSWEAKVQFNQAMHFLTLSPFHTSNSWEDSKALGMFMKGALLLNRLYSDLRGRP